MALAAPSGLMASAEASSYTVTYNLGTWGSMPGYSLLDGVTQTKQAGPPLTLLTATPTYATGTVSYRAQLDANGGMFSDGTGTTIINSSSGGNLVFQGYDGSDGKSYSPGDTYSTDADLTLTARWGSDDQSSLLPAVTREGYRCIGYYTAKEGGTFVGNPGEQPKRALYAGDYKGYARWEAISESGNGNSGNSGNSGNGTSNDGSASDGSQSDNDGTTNDGNGTTNGNDDKTTDASGANGSQANGSQAIGQNGQATTKYTAGSKKGDLVATGALSSKGALIAFITAAVSACGWTVARKHLRRS